MTERRERIAFSHQSRYYKEPRPVRHIPTREQLEAAARQQAAYEASIQEADLSYSGHSAGIHPEHRPYITGERSPHTHAPVSCDGGETMTLKKTMHIIKPDFPQAHDGIRVRQLIPEGGESTLLNIIMSGHSGRTGNNCHHHTSERDTRTKLSTSNHYNTAVSILCYG